MMLIARVGTSIDYQSRLLGENRVGFALVSLKAAECVLLRLRLDTLSKTCRADCWIESNIEASVSFYWPRACARVLLAHEGCWQVNIWAKGHFACAAFRHTLIVEADARGVTWNPGIG